MIRATTTLPDGRVLIILGLSDRNLEMLMAKKSAVFDLKPLAGVEGEIIIMHGATEQAMYDELKNLGVLDAEKTILHDAMGITP